MNRPLWVGQLVWGYDPQDAPLDWVRRVDWPIVTDVDGVELVVMEDQDGEQFVEPYRDAQQRQWEAESGAF